MLGTPGKQGSSPEYARGIGYPVLRSSSERRCPATRPSASDVGPGMKIGVPGDSGNDPMPTRSDFGSGTNPSTLPDSSPAFVLGGTGAKRAQLPPSPEPLPAKPPLPAAFPALPPPPLA